MTGLFSPVQPGSEGCPPKMCADEVGDEDEGQFWEKLLPHERSHIGVVALHILELSPDGHTAISVAQEPPKLPPE